MSRPEAKKFPPCLTPEQGDVNINTATTCRCGGTGRHLGLKIPYPLRMYGFEPRHRHHVGTNCAPLRPPALPGDIRSAPFVPPFQNRNRCAGLRFCFLGGAGGLLRPAVPRGFAAGHALRSVCSSFSKSQPLRWVAILFFGGARCASLSCLAGGFSTGFDKFLEISTAVYYYIYRVFIKPVWWWGTWKKS